MPVQLRSLTDHDSYAAPTRECDIIMKGGITSGVVYPLAACRLATDYRLRQLGGSSAGAIAAAMAAAAEHGRHSDRPDAGFSALAGLPNFLGTNLLGLFQPMPETQPAFDLLMGLTDKPSRAARLKAFVLGLIKAQQRTFWLLTLPVVAVVALLVWLAVRDADALAVIAAVLLGLVIVAVAVLVAAAWAALRAGRGWLSSTSSAMTSRGFGLVNGHDPTGATEPLTDWMSRTFNELAGLDGAGRPLTLGDLWGEQASEVYRRLRQDDQASPADWTEFRPEVNLTVTTTCLEQARPYQFPFNTNIFHFCPECLAQYFPSTVMQHLIATARPASVVTDGERTISMQCPRHPDVTVSKLPAAPDLPVVMAARLSLSFPVLICAVPLCYIDFARGPGHRELIVGWFSDGGITTNFPMQFFDTLVPTRPTFGINLQTAHPDFADSEVYRIRQAGERLVRSTPVTSFVGLFGAIRTTMQGWVDAMQMEVPGFRDRVVEVTMREGEGGLNLAMPASVIDALSHRGDLAGQDLLGFDFETHRWIRFRTTMASVSEVLEHLHPARAGAAVESLPQPWRGSYAFASQSAEQAVREEFEQLRALGAQWRAEGYPATGEGSPHPVPLLRHVLRR